VGFLSITANPAATIMGWSCAHILICATSVIRSGWKLPLNSGQS
jgi:hypothetical protein